MEKVSYEKSISKNQYRYQQHPKTRVRKTDTIQSYVSDDLQTPSPIDTNYQNNVYPAIPCSLLRHEIALHAPLIPSKLSHNTNR